MSDVTKLLQGAAQGDLASANQLFDLASAELRAIAVQKMGAAAGDRASENELFDLVYAELRAIAVQKRAAERPGHPLQATALVNEAYLRLGGAQGLKFENRAHFFASAAEAMRRILVGSARR